jgi:hypothetical protein
MATVHTPGITFTTHTKSPSCPVSISIHDDATNLDLTLECELVAGHRHRKHVYRATMNDGDELEIFWSKARIPDVP